MKTLLPFSITEQTKGFTVEVAVHEVSSFELRLDFFFKGDLQSILWPTAPTQQRSNNLWQHTCLECFYTSTSSDSSYTEINCSPQGSWNAYSFFAYREGMAPSEDTTVTLLQSRIDKTQAFFAVHIQRTTALDLNTLGLSAVIEFKDGSCSYWALSHPSEQADFHDSKAWTALSTR